MPNKLSPTIISTEENRRSDIKAAACCIVLLGSMARISQLINSFNGRIMSLGSGSCRAALRTRRLRWLEKKRSKARY